MVKKKNHFTNFKIHTQYSICEGAIKIEDLADFCKLNKIPAIGLSDSHNLCGALEFSESISKVGTQPIIGTQINFEYLDIIGKLPIFAKTETGYGNLVKLSSKSFLETKEKETPHCKIEELLKNSDSKLAKDYLKERNLTAEIVKKFNIGYVKRNPSFYETLIKKFDEKILKECGLFYLDEKKKNLRRAI